MSQISEQSKPENNLSKPPKVAVATVSTPSFVQGTQALLSSFIANNHGADYDLVIIGDDLPQIASSFSKFSQVKFHSVGDQLQQAAKRVGEQNKLLRNKLAQFYSLEIFNLTGYDKVLFLDSDIVCQQNITPLLSYNCDLGACYDRAWFMNKHRLYNSFYMVEPENSEAKGRTLFPSYNSGVLLVDKVLINHSTYHRLIERIDSIDWRDTSGVNDQIIINQYFEGKIEPLPETYNYITERVGFDSEKSQYGVDETCFVHFIGHPKPWNFKKIIKGLLKGGRAPENWSVWLKAYWKYLRMSPSGS